MNPVYVWCAFVAAFSPLVFSLVIAHRDERRARREARDEFLLIAEREAANTALRQPYRWASR